MLASYPGFWKAWVQDTLVYDEMKLQGRRIDAPSALLQTLSVLVPSWILLVGHGPLCNNTACTNG